MEKCATMTDYHSFPTWGLELLQRIDDKLDHWNNFLFHLDTSCWLQLKVDIQQEHA